MSNPIYPCLWFDNQAEVAAKFYISVFKNGSIVASNSIVVTIDVHDQKFMLLNGGLKFKINPSMSFYMVCESKREIDELWSELEQEGNAAKQISLERKVRLGSGSLWSLLAAYAWKSCGNGTKVYSSTDVYRPAIWEFGARHQQVHRDFQ